jgi:hypothetical protein
MPVKYEQRVAVIIVTDRAFDVKVIVGPTEQFHIVIPDQSVQPSPVPILTEQTVDRLPSLQDIPQAEALEFLDIAIENQRMPFGKVVVGENLLKHVGVFRKIIGPASIAQMEVAEYDDLVIVGKRSDRCSVEETLKVPITEALA